MSATTIKLEADLVKKVTALKPKDESISGFVRELIEKEHRARENRASAVVYQQFLEDNPDERAAMEVWESAPLVDEIEPKKP
jgi:predicted CopG family antitoxin